jgi:hypothetical protein
MRDPTPALVPAASSTASATSIRARATPISARETRNLHDARINAYWRAPYPARKTYGAIFRDGLLEIATLAMGFAGFALCGLAIARFLA